MVSQTKTAAKASKADIDGVLLLDKPIGLSSNAALQKVKRLYNARKAGHTGSLDPLASGLLPICFGEATKLSAYLLSANKSYQFTCQLGITTDTGDAEGKITGQHAVNCGLTDVNTVLQRFQGSIEQLPPMYSALKHQGKRLYELARKGIEVERKPRSITIYELRLLSFVDDCLECFVRCSKGTYIRTLAEDIGKQLGCGAHITALRRTAVAPYDTQHMVTMSALQAQAERHNSTELMAMLLPLDSALSNWPMLKVNADAAHYLRSGNPVRLGRLPTDAVVAGNNSAAQWVRLYDQAKRFLGIGEVLLDGRVAPRRMLRNS